MLPFSAGDLRRHVDEGWVTERSHPTLPLKIYNYAPECQFRNFWNDVTLNCRGLILDENFKIVARPWKKFFNLGQVDLPFQFTDPVEVMDKADGSLGILYPAGEEFAIATRGSFESTQAIAGTKIWNESYSHLDVPEGVTFLFEILLPWNRIVLYYDYESEYLQQGRGVLSSGSTRNDSRKYLHSAEERLEDLSSLQERSAAQGPDEAREEEERECPEVETGERGAFSGTVYADLQENSTEDSGSQDGQALRGLQTDISSGLHGLRPSAGNGQKIQHRSGSEPTSVGRGNGEVRTGVRELSQDSNLDYTQGNLVLLGAVDNLRGFYYGPREAAALLNWNGPVVKVFDHKTLSDALGDMARSNAEGFVVRSHNFMVKMKQPDYLDLHRLVTGVSPKRVWEQLRDGKSVEQIVSAFPDEFHDYVKGMADPLMEQFRTRVDEIASEYIRLVLPVIHTSRKTIAQTIAHHPDRKYFFMRLDGKQYGEVLWNELKPREENEGEV